jgi:ATP-dependent exoDNAse (exonuclease V) beta subunit
MKYIRSFLNNTYDETGRIYHLTEPIRYDLPKDTQNITKADKSYYSVTTALGATADKEFLVAWRERLGEEEADKQVEKAQNFGTQFHLVGEHFLKQSELTEKINPFVKIVFTRLIPKLRPHITKVISVEGVLYSDVAMLAGRADGIVEWDGKLAVIDYKLVNFWNPEFIHDYWLQCSIYAHMYEFMYDERPKKIILAMGNKNTGLAQVLIKDPNDYAKEAVGRIIQFRQKMGIS